MPNFVEDLPEHMPDQVFPLGDVVPVRIEAAETLYDAIDFEVSNGDCAQLLNTLRKGEVKGWVYRQDQLQNYRDIKDLHETWAKDAFYNDDVDPKRGRQITNVGTFTTLAFARHSSLFPTRFVEFTEDLKVLGDYDHDMRQFFAKETWSHMGDVHPGVYSVLIPLLGKMGSILDIPVTNDPELQLLSASAALPYLMSYTTAMIKHQNESGYELPMTDISE